MTVPEKALSDTDIESPSFFLTKRFWLVMACQTGFGLGWSALLIQPKFLAQELGADPSAIGTISAMSGFAAVCTIPVVTHFIDRVGRRPLLQAGAVVLTALSLGLLAVDRVGPLVYLLHAGMGASFVLSFNASAALVTDLAPPQRMGQAIGALGASNMLMNALATMGAERVAEVYGWPAVFQLGAAAGVLALVLSFLIKEARRDAGPAEPGGGTKLRLRGWLVRALAASAVAAAPFSAMFTFHQPFALELGASRVASFFLGFMVTAVTMRVVFGSLGDRYGRRRVSLLSLIGYAAVAAATARLQIDWLWLYGAVFGVAHGVLYPTLNAFAVECAPDAVRGRVITLFNGAFNAGYAISTLGWGALAAAVGFPAVFVAATVVALGGAALLWDSSAGGGASAPSPLS